MDIQNGESDAAKRLPSYGDRGADGGGGGILE